MRPLNHIGVAALLLAGAVAATAQEPRPREDALLEAGVSRALAASRAAALSNVVYDLRFIIPASRDEPVRGVARVSLERAHRSAPVTLDFDRPRSSILAVRISGRAAGFGFINGHIVLPAEELRTDTVTVEVEFVAGDGPLNRNDGFLYTLFVPDRAHEAFPCFDQPDLKARYRLTLDIPVAWQAVANGPEVSRRENGPRAVVTFAATRPLSTYLFAFAAGDFQVETAERDGRTMRMFHRETDREKVERNRDAIFDLHARALAWLEDYTGVPYPFDKFDFVLIPSFQYGGMEHAGAILYRASSLMLDASSTLNQELGRASVIAHETAHMWFGDLVTMRWFGDVWLKEVMANFFAAKIVNPSFPDVDHDLRFLLAHYPSAYAVDRTAGANPIRQELDNLNDAGQLYGAIIYQKAPIVMRHLEGLVGAEAFQAGMRTYLRRYAYGNATWPDLVAILDRGTTEDLATWSDAWVAQPGRPTIATEPVRRGGRLASLGLTQSDPRGRGLVWTQRLRVALGYGDSVAWAPVRLDAPRVAVDAAAGQDAPQWILANGGGEGYGLFRPDTESLGWLLQSAHRLPTAELRAVAWLTLWDAMLEGDVEANALLDEAVRYLRSEPDELVIQDVLGDLSSLYWRYLPPGARERRSGSLEAFLWDRLQAADRARLKAAYFNAWRSVVLNSDGVTRLERLWRGEDTVEGLELSESDLTSMALDLAVREVDGAESILAEQRERIENPDRRARFDFVVPSVSADPAVRDSVFASLALMDNRRREPWALSALRYLNHPLRTPRAERYLLPGLELLEEIQRTGDIFFPTRWLDALFAGHRTPEATAIIRAFLDDRPDYPFRLREKILQAADPVFRAAAYASAE